MIASSPAWRALIKNALGIEVEVELAGRGETAPFTEVDRRQKPIRLIDERTPDEGTRWSRGLLACDATGLGERFSAGEADPHELLEACLARIAECDAVIGACNHRAELDALRDQAARSWDRWQSGSAKSPLDGIPFGVKANIAVQGMPWHAGIAALRDRVPIAMPPASPACAARA